MAKRTSKKKSASVVNERWKAKSHTQAENLKQANARIKEFVLKDVESPSYNLTTQFLENNPHKEVTLKQGNRTIYYNVYTDGKGLSPKERRANTKSITKFLESDTGTIKKYDKVLRKRYETFTSANDINRRRFTFNQYKKLFENYNQLFESSYEDSDKVVIAIVAHTFMYGQKATEEWLNTLSDKIKDRDNQQKIEDLVDKAYEMRYEKADEIDWKY